jgi:hypothetical protein
VSFDSPALQHFFSSVVPICNTFYHQMLFFAASLSILGC